MISGLDAGNVVHVQRSPQYSFLSMLLKTGTDLSALSAADFELGTHFVFRSGFVIHHSISATKIR